MNDVVIVAAARTPIGKHRGALSKIRPDDLAAHVLSSVLERAPGSRELVEEVIFGCTNQAGEDNRNVARMALLLANLPYEVTGVTVNRLCGSGMQAIIEGSRAIRCGDADVVVAGGVESMTRAPYAMAKPDEPFKSGPPQVFDTSLGWRFPNPRMTARFPLDSMGETAENVAEKYHVGRADQDAYAYASHRKAAEAWEHGFFSDEVVPVPIPADKKGHEPTFFARDESIRPDVNIEKLATLAPVFRKGGSVTAGNSSPLNDGASAVLLASEKCAVAHGWKPLARIVGSAVAGVDPSYMGIGPVSACHKLFAKTGLDADRFDLVELNEAFASQALACIRELHLDTSRVNVHGGGIALGHPIGSSGCRIVATLVHTMRQRKARRGLAALCIGVGQGLALALEGNPSA